MIRLLRMGLLRVLLGLGVLAVLLGGTGYWLYHEGLQRPLALPSAEFHYTLRPGVTLRQTAADLAAQGVMNYPVALTWLVWARWQQRAHQIRAGEYAIAPGTTPRQLLELFISGKTVQYSGAGRPSQTAPHPGRSERCATHGPSGTAHPAPGRPVFPRHLSI